MSHMSAETELTLTENKNEQTKTTTIDKANIFLSMFPKHQIVSLDLFEGFDHA